MSRLDFNYKSDLETVQFSLFMFIDDFETMTKEENKEEVLKLFTEKESPYSDSLIYNYIDSNLIISIDDEQKKMKYLGREIDEKDLQGMWIYLEIENQNAFEYVEIKNSILTEAFSDQRNIINVMVDSNRKAYHILDKKNYTRKIKI